MKTLRVANSSANQTHISEHKLRAYPPRSGSLSLSGHRLRVVSGAIIQSSPDCLMETLPELGHILHPLIRHYAHRGSMNPENVIHIEICELLSSVVIPHSYEVSYLGQSINNYPDRVIPFQGLR